MNKLFVWEQMQTKLHMHTRSGMSLVSVSLFPCMPLFQTLLFLMRFSMPRALDFESNNSARASYLLVPSKEVMCLSVCLSQNHLRLIPDLIFSIYADLLFSSLIVLP